jgi:hypothetical protein
MLEEIEEEMRDLIRDAKSFIGGQGPNAAISSVGLGLFAIAKTLEKKEEKDGRDCTCESESA